MPNKSANHAEKKMPPPPPMPRMPVARYIARCKSAKTGIHQMKTTQNARNLKTTNKTRIRGRGIRRPAIKTIAKQIKTINNLNLKQNQKAIVLISIDKKKRIRIHLVTLYTITTIQKPVIQNLMKK